MRAQEGARSNGRSGFAMLVTVLVMLLLASLGLASLNVVRSDQQVAGFQNRKRVALNAAEAGVSVAISNLSANGIPSLANTPLADTTLYSHGQPSFQTDPAVTDPLLMLGTGTLGNMGLGIGQNNSNQFQVQFWRINVEGNGPGGTRARLEVVTGALQAN
jgi:hypothetical protein